MSAGSVTCIRRFSLERQLGAVLADSCRVFSTDAYRNKTAWENLSKRTQELAKLLVVEDAHEDFHQGHCHTFHQRRALSQAITLIESQKPEHQIEGNHLLSYLLSTENNRKRKSNSFRLGIAGPPGAGELISVST